MSDDEREKEPLTGGRRALDHAVVDLVSELRSAVFGHLGDTHTGLLRRVGTIEDGHEKIREELAGLRSGIKVGFVVLTLLSPVLTGVVVVLLTGQT